ncbi:hypothetical protein [Rhizobium lusitanum]|nr:hypothetical protein [Rhizobium lusitanum]
MLEVVFGANAVASRDHELGEPGVLLISFEQALLRWQVTLNLRGKVGYS